MSLKVLLSVTMVLCWRCVDLSLSSAMDSTSSSHYPVRRDSHLGETAGPSTIANEFVVGFMRNYIKPSNYPYDLLRLNNTYLFITTDDADGVIVTITFNGRDTAHYISPSGSELRAAETIQLPTGTRVEGQWDRNKGIRVKAEGSKHITLQCFNEEIHSVEGYTAMPCIHLPTVSEYVYYAVSAPRTSISRTPGYREPHSMFLIVACEDDTRVTITPSQQIQNPNNPSVTVSRGENVTVVLDALQTLLIENLDDLTGSRVVTSAPISFISGHECGNIPYNLRECDHLVEQLPPTANWGSEFFTASTSGRIASDTVELMSSNDNATIVVSCGKASGTSRKFSVNIEYAGDTKNFTLVQGEFCHITANSLVLVVQYTPGRYAELERGKDSTGDPFMLLVPSVTQYLNEVLFSTAQGFDFTALSFTNYLNLFVPERPETFNSNNILINGEPVSQSDWSQVPCATETESLRSICGHVARITAPEQQAVKVAHTEPRGKVGVAVYGISVLETYAYFAALKITLNEAPYLLEPVQTSFTILYDYPLCLHCQLSHTFDAPKIEWTFNGRAIDSNNTDGLDVFANGTLCITAASAAHVGGYVCNAGAQNLNYTVSVTSGVLIKSPSCLPIPTSSSVVLIGIGETPTTYIELDTTAVEICCPTEGPVVSLQWLVDGALIANSSKYFIGLDYLRISGGFQDGCVTYTCKVSFLASGTVEQATEVCAGRTHPPTNVNIDGPMEILEGQPFTLTCSAMGFPLPTIVWSVFGDLLPSVATNLPNGLLSVTGLQGEDDSRFCCDVGNSKGTRSKCVTLTVLVPPKIRQPQFITTVITHSQPDIPDIPEVSGLPSTDDPTSGLLTKQGTAKAGQIVMVHKSFHLRIECEIEKGYPSPVTSWTKGGERLMNSSKYEVYKSGALVVKSVDVSDKGIYTCVATSDGLGSDQINTTVSIIVSPEIAPPTPPFRSPGSCKDVRKNTTVHQQIGVDLCTQAGNTTQLYLTCNTRRGIPKPNITWYKDHLSINASTEDITLFENGTLLVQGLLVPVEAKVKARTDLSGTYTCVAVNIAGITNASSYILPMGGVSEEVLTHHLQPLHRDLYEKLYSAIADETADLASGEQHLALLTYGKLLDYNEFNPGRDFDGGEDTVSQDVMERYFKLTDVIPDSESIVTDLRESHSLSETYEFLVNQLRVVAVDIRPSDLQDARSYLQEKVEDLGNSDENSRPIPRLSLYLKYKNSYYRKKLEMEDIIDSKRRILTGYHFSEWYDRHAGVLNAQVDDAYIEWDLFGNKAEVTKWLKVLKLLDDSSPLDFSESLEDAKALFVATKTRSWFREDVVYRPVQIIPTHWYRLLKNRVEESIEQLQYHIANLKSQKEVLDVTAHYLNSEAEKAEYCNRPSLEFPIPISCPKDPLDDPSSVVNQLSLVRYFLEHEVERSEMFRYRCLATRNPEDCHLYSVENDAVVHLMDTYADLYFVVQLITTARDHRDASSSTLRLTIKTLEKEIQLMESLVQVRIVDSADRTDDNEIKIASESARLLTFDYKSTSKKFSPSFVNLPDVVRNRFLWHFEYSSADMGYYTGDSGVDYDDVIAYLNSIETNVTADVFRVNVKRRWFKPLLFGNKHLRLNNHSLLVSPGVIYPPKKFRQTVANDTYLLPVYPSAIILATGVKLTLTTPFPLFILPTLLRMSYDEQLSGGFGPFTFGKMFRTSTRRMKFKVSVRNNNIVITLPGTQLLGYICDITPQHPPEMEGVKREKRASFFEASDKDNLFNIKHSNKFNRWLLLKNKEIGSVDFDQAEMDKRFSAENGLTIIPTSTIASSVVGQSYVNESLMSQPQH